MIKAVRLRILVLLALVAAGPPATALDVGVKPGAKTLSGTFFEWPIPTPKFPRDPAVAPDGSIYFAVRLGGRIGRFDPKHKRFQEWSLPAGVQPQGVVVASDGNVIFGGTDIHELDPSSGAVKQYDCPSRNSKPYSLIMGADANTVWFTQREVGKLGKLDRSSGRITEYRIGDDPYALAMDTGGNVWVTRKAADRITKFNPATGRVTELVVPAGSQPRRIALAPDGKLWVSLYGSGRLIQIDPVAGVVIKEYALPGGPNGGPYAVIADAAGRIWVSEVQTDSVIMLNPRSQTLRVFKLPTRDTGVRSATIDALGRYWYVGSLSGRLGAIE